MEKKEKKTKKARHWAIIVYPESAPEKWEDVLSKTGCACAISPLHNQDINETTGEVKKAHWHVIVSYANTTTYNNVQTLAEELNAPNPQAINSVKGAIRYLTHQDNPEKHQYDSKDIRTLNGFDIEEYNQLTKTEIYELKREIIEYILNNNITDYAYLLEYTLETNFNWFKVVADNTILFDKVCTSVWKRNKIKSYYKNKKKRS